MGSRVPQRHSNITSDLRPAADLRPAMADRERLAADLERVAVDLRRAAVGPGPALYSVLWAYSAPPAYPAQSASSAPSVYSAQAEQLQRQDLSATREHASPLSPRQPSRAPRTPPMKRIYRKASPATSFGHKCETDHNDSTHAIMIHPDCKRGSNSLRSSGSRPMAPRRDSSPADPACGVVGGVLADAAFGAADAGSGVGLLPDGAGGSGELPRLARH